MTKKAKTDKGVEKKASLAVVVDDAKKTSSRQKDAKEICEELTEAAKLQGAIGVLVVVIKDNAIAHKVQALDIQQIVLVKEFAARECDASLDASLNPKKA